MWTFIGFVGQFIFFSRFVFQWWFSERAGKVVQPAFFWVLSIVGGLIILAYSIHEKDTVFIAAYTLNTILYGRMLFLQLKTSKNPANQPGRP